MTLAAFEDFLYGACLLDWEAEHARHAAARRPFDAADEVRIVGDDTDLTLSLAGRRGEVDAGCGTCPAASSSSPGRGLGRGLDRVHRVPGRLRSGAT